MIRSKILVQNTIRVSSVLYIILFVYAAVSKFLDFQQFKIQLGQSPIITAYAAWIAWGIPLLELVIATLFLFQRWMLLAFYSSFALMTMFTTYILIMLNFSDYIPCSCGGVLEQLGWTEHIVFNGVFVAMAVIAIYFLEHQQIPNKSVES